MTVIIDVEPGSDHLTGQLNLHGKDGWELVSTTPVGKANTGNGRTIWFGGDQTHDQLLCIFKKMGKAPVAPLPRPGTSR